MKILSRSLVVLLVFFAFIGKANAILLETLYASDNGGGDGGAIYFDLLTGGQGINITGLFSNTDSTSTSSGFNVYTKLGTAEGSELNSGAWTLATGGTITGLGDDLKSSVSLDSIIMLDASTLYGIALVMPSGFGHEYTNGTCAVSYTNNLNCGYSDANLTLLAGSATNIPFSNANGGPFSPRVWNGGIEYELKSGDIPTPTTLALLGLGLAGLGWSRRKQNS